MDATDLQSRLLTALGPAWPSVAALGRVAAVRGQQPWLVGGGVRDLLLGRGVRDVDLVVEGDARGLAEAVAAAEGGTVLGHAAFGTAKWTPAGGGTPLDLATARTETYPSPACLPVVAPAGLDADLARRDFSINAMALGTWGAQAGELRDPHGGQADLDAGVLRILHPRSFEDDPTRALRAARFAARFSLALEPRTAAWLAEAVATGAFLPLGAERLGAELDRLLHEPDPVEALRRLGAWGLAPVVLPGLGIDEEMLSEAAALVAACAEASALAPDARAPVADALWMRLSDGLGPSVRAERVRMVPGGGARHARFRAGLGAVRAAVGALAGPDPGAAGHMLRGLDPVALAAVLALGSGAAQAHVRWWLRDGRRVRLGLDGRDLLAAGVPAGPGLGRALDAAWTVAWRGAGSVEQRAAALEAARS
jgi:tRNA nucleotidyltransferase (CCA-adding enzyme)